VTTIQRRKVVTEQIEVPAGMHVCPVCKGAAMISRYDEGVSSLVHSPELAALRCCWRCNGVGYVEVAP